MDFSAIHLQIVIVSVVVAYLSLKVFVVFPAWKRYRTQKAKASLAKCFRMLNQGPLSNGQISNGHYLHDQFYKVLFMVLMHDDLKMTLIGSVKHTVQEEERRQAFRREVDNLDEETRNVVRDAVAAIGIIVFLQNLIMFPRAILKSNQARYKYKQHISEEMIRSGEYISISAEQNIKHGCAA